MSVDAHTNRLHASISGQAASTIAEWASIRRAYPIQVLVVPTHEISERNPLAREKLAPLLSLFSIVDEQAGRHSEAGGLQQLAGKGTRPHLPAGLGPCEVEVLRLVTQSKRNHEIAEDLAISSQK